MFDFNEQLRRIERNLHEALGAYLVYDSIMQKAVSEEKFLNKINANIYFWHSVIYSLQATYILCMGRLFDDNSKILSINAFLNKCTENIHIFSKEELKKRKTGIFQNYIDLQDYIDNAFEPTREDFKDIKNIVKSYKKEYDKNYRDIRNKVFGHTEITKKEDLEKLFLNTSRKKLEEIFLMLKHILIGLFSLYHNGHKIELSNQIYTNSFNLFTKIKEESDIVFENILALEHL